MNKWPRFQIWLFYFLGFLAFFFGLCAIHPGLVAILASFLFFWLAGEMEKECEEKEPTVNETLDKIEKKARTDDHHD